MNNYRGRRRPLTLAIGLVAILSSPMPVARAADGNVDEVGTSFQPAEVRIGLRDRVVWTNRSSQSHTVTFTGDPPGDLNPNCDPGALGLLRTGCQAPGSTVGYTFTKAGTYEYYCKIHTNVPMRGVVVVGATAPSSSNPSSSGPNKTSSTTATTLRATSSTTTTTRALATSSTLVPSSTTSTTSEATSVLLPGEPPPFSDDTSSAANRSGGTKGGSDSSTVAMIVGLLLAASVGGGFLLWRLRPGRP
jgi:plastocyanin